MLLKMIVFSDEDWNLFVEDILNMLGQEEVTYENVDEIVNKIWEIVESEDVIGLFIHFNKRAIYQDLHGSNQYGKDCWITINNPKLLRDFLLRY